MAWHLNRSRRAADRRGDSRWERSRWTILVALFLGLAAPLRAAEPKPATQPEAKPEAAVSTDDTKAPKNIAEVKALESKIHKTLQKVIPCVVSIGGGSGVVVSEDGYVLTVAHVNEKPGRNVMFIFPDGRRAKGTTLGNDQCMDAGLMKISDPGPWPHVEMGKSADLKSGQWCLAISYPGPFEHGRAPVVRAGRVSRQTKSVIDTDCTIMGGDSGGPLFDLDGRVVGVSSRCEDSVFHNFHVPIDRYHETWERLVKGEDFHSLSHADTFLGVEPAEKATDATVGGIVPDSAADKAGLKTGDVIVRFEGEAVSDFADLTSKVQHREAGDKVRIEVRRGAETMRFQVVLGRRGSTSTAERNPTVDRPENLTAATPEERPRRGRRRSSDIGKKSEPQVKAAFNEVLSPVSAATVRILADGKPVALGTVVEADGYVVTKASLLKGQLTCRLPDARVLEAQTVGENKDYDIALLHVAAQDLPVVPWRSEEPPPAGSFLATTSPGADPVALGIVSTEPRRIRGSARGTSKSWLGISLGRGDAGTVIESVAADSPAAKAGLLAGDRIKSLGGREVTTSDQVIDTVNNHDPGEDLKLSIQRGDKELELTAKLAKPQRAPAMQDKWGGGPFSERRFGFPLALPHDTVLSPNDCGGPVVDSDGHVVGVNIARALRVTTYAVPAKKVQEIVQELKKPKD